MSSFTGILQLFRLALRRDRLKLPIWIVVIVGLIFVNVSSIRNIYNTEEGRHNYAVSSASSAATRVFNGPITGTDMGSVVLAETFASLVVAVALMSTLVVVRHTRQNEEAGRSELVGAGVVGRYAMLGAALLEAIAANVLLAGLVGIGLAAGGLPLDGSLLMGAAMGMVGVIFAAIAAIAAQLTLTSRGANSLAAATVGAMFLVRAVGDVKGTIQASGTAVVSAWPTWLSPIGIGRETLPYTQNRWWVLGLMALIFAVCAAIAFAILAHRDVGAGILPARRGPATAPVGLRSIWGLAWRLQRGVWFGWAIGISIVGATFGVVLKEMTSFAQGNPEMEKLITQLGGSQMLVEAFLGYAIIFMAMLASAYLVQALLRIRTEENRGFLELVLAGNVRRSSWFLSHLLWVMGGAAVILCIAGVSIGLAYGLVTSEPLHYAWTYGKAALQYVPATLLFGGATALAFGLFPRFAIALSWGFFAIAMVITQFGEILKLPSWAKDISPLTHAPLAHLHEPLLLPLGAASAVTIGACLLGMLAFRRRDITTA